MLLAEKKIKRAEKRNYKLHMNCNPFLLRILTTTKLFSRKGKLIQSYSPLFSGIPSRRPAAQYTMAANSAAWLTAAKAKPLEVKPAPLWTPGENEILVRNHAVAINPVDGANQTIALFSLNYPAILGHDVAGEVVAVGPNVTNFEPGTRVLGHAVGLITKRDSDNAFQAYTILRTNMAAEIPDGISFENAAVVPLGFSTAACGLFEEAFLNLQLPTEPAAPSTGQTVLIWGGASSVGINAIQLAVAAGYSVITTASPKNFEYVKKFGASEALDYHSPTVVADLVAALKGKTMAGGLDCVGAAAWTACTSVVAQSSGAKFVATVKRGFPDPPAGVTMKQVFAINIKDSHVGHAVYQDFLPGALKAGTFVPAPEPIIAGKGLESVQGAIELYQKGGISANKIVVTL